jgi:hypothetical protein
MEGWQQGVNVPVAMPACGVAYCLQEKAEHGALILFQGRRPCAEMI